MKALYSCYYITPNEPKGHILETGMFVENENDMDVLYCTALDLFKFLIQEEYGKKELFKYEAITKEVFIEKFHSALHDDYDMAPVVDFSNDSKHYSVGIMKFPGI